MKPYRDKETLKYLYHDRKWSLEKIGRRFGIDETTVLDWMKRHSIPRRTKREGFLNSVGFRPPIFVTESDGREMMKVYDPGIQNKRSIPISRMLAIALYGLSEVAGSDVHHKNEIPWDNRPSNIELKEPGDHMRHHRKTEVTECPNCSNPFPNYCSIGEEYHCLQCGEVW